MRTKNLFLALALVSGTTFAQNSVDQHGTASPQSRQGNAMEGSESMKEMHGEGAKAGAMQEMHGSQADMMKSAQRDLEGMRVQLKKMRDQTAGASGQASRDGQQLNNDMWQALIDHMDKHMSMMNAMEHSTPDAGNGNAGVGKSPAVYAQ